MPARMTLTAWVCGLRNMVVTSVIPLGLVSLGTWLVSSVFHWSTFAALGLSLALFIAASLLLFFGCWWRDLASRGAVLLECGPHPWRIVFLLNAAVFAVAGLAGGLTGGRALPWHPTAVLVFLFSYSAFWTFLALGHLQACEAGIWGYWGLVRWEKIASCRWSGRGDNTLLLQARRQIPLLGRGAIPFPPESKQAMVELLAKRCPAWDPDF
jgi:hypothetical protein